MKHAFVLLLAAALFSSLGWAQSNADNDLTKRLIGVWQDAPSVGSGYGQRFRFSPDGRYVWQVSESLCDARIRERSGTWRVRNGRLEVFATSQRVLVGGRLENAPNCAGQAIVGATLTTQSIRQLDASRWVLSAYQAANTNAPYPSILLGDKRWYRLSGNPNDHKS